MQSSFFHFKNATAATHGESSVVGILAMMLPFALVMSILLYVFCCSRIELNRYDVMEERRQFQI